MVSEYGYITVANLEDFTSEDYGTIDATYLSDAKVEAKISSAERIINNYCSTTFTGTIPDGIVVATSIISERLILKWLLNHNFELSDNQKKEALKPLLDDDIKSILDSYKVINTAPIRLHRFYTNVGYY